MVSQSQNTQLSNKPRSRPPSNQPQPRLDVTIVMGGQFGSEGKGEFVAWYAARHRPSAVIRVGGPNAGHTMTLEGKTFKMRHIPCAWHTPADLYLGPGALVNMEVLHTEMAMLIANDPGYFEMAPRDITILHIDRSAIVITDDHMKSEHHGDMWTKIGSTMEGVGAARADRIMRTARLWGDVHASMSPRESAYLASVDVRVKLDQLKHSTRDHNVLVESTQGYGLSLTYSGNYPHVTSSDITPCQALNDAGLGGVRNYQVIGVMRTYPIRVAGNSGEMFNEVTWEELSRRTGGLVKSERTTVTNRIRRVGEWDKALAREFGQACAPDAVCLTMVDYVVPECHNMSVTQLMADPNARRKIAVWLDKVERDVGAPVEWIGTGPGVIVPVCELHLGDLS